MTSAGIETATFRFGAQRLNHCAAAVPCEYIGAGQILVIFVSDCTCNTQKFFPYSRICPTLYTEQLIWTDLHEKGRFHFKEIWDKLSSYAPLCDLPTRQWITTFRISPRGCHVGVSISFVVCVCARALKFNVCRKKREFGNNQQQKSQGKCIIISNTSE